MCVGAFVFMCVCVVSLHLVCFVFYACPWFFMNKLQVNDFTVHSAHTHIMPLDKLSSTREPFAHIYSHVVCNRYTIIRDDEWYINCHLYCMMCIVAQQLVDQLWWFNVEISTIHHCNENGNKFYVYLLFSFFFAAVPFSSWIFAYMRPICFAVIFIGFIDNVNLSLMWRKKLN